MTERLIMFTGLDTSTGIGAIPVGLSVGSTVLSAIVLSAGGAAVAGADVTSVFGIPVQSIPQVGFGIPLTPINFHGIYLTQQSGNNLGGALILALISSP